jgi:CelD/BcsL family acetyltransferase involved in cellulose biosynthesis
VDYTTPRVPVESYVGIDSIAADWDELADRIGASVWLRPGWISAWVEAFGGKGDLSILADQRDGRLAGVLPMLRRRRGFTSPTNWHTPEFGPLVEDAEARAALAEALFAGRPRSVTVGWVSTEGIHDLRAAAGRKHYRVLERSIMRSPYLPLGAGQHPAASSHPPRNSTVRRHRRKLEKAGELRFTVDASMEHLPEGFRVEASGWKEKEGTAIISQPETHQFYRQIAKWAVQRDVLRLCFLRLDDRPIAFVLALEDDDRLYYVKGGFDAEFSRFGPGVIITHAMVEYATERGLRSFEFLGGEDPWKLEWTREVRERLLFQAFSPSPSGLGEWALYAHLRPLVKRFITRRQ